MKSFNIPVLALALTVLSTAPAAFAEHHEAEAPTEGFRAELLWDLGNVEKKLLGLADAIPADSYGWGPAPEVRSTAASFVHVAQGNHQILAALGVEAPEDVADWEAEITAKDDVKAALESSFAAVRGAILGHSDDELDAQVSFFGREWSKRQVLMLVAGHAHEHLGQAIVYARSMGVVPPWSRSADDDGDGGDEENG